MTISPANLWLLTLGSRVTTTAMTVLNFVVVARALGPEDAGRYFLFVSTVFVIAVFAEGGLSQSATVFAAQYSGSVRLIHRILIRYTATFSALTAVVGFVGVQSARHTLLPGLSTGWILLAFVTVPFAVYANLWSGLAVGLRRLMVANAVQLAVAAVSVLLNCVFLVLLPGGAAAALIVYVFVLASQAALMVWLAGRFEVSHGSLAPPSVGREMLRFGFRGYPGAVSTFVWQRAAVFLLNVFHGPVSVSIFSVAQQLAEKMLLPVQVMKEVIYREIASASRAEAARATNRYLKLTVAALVPLMLVLAWAAPILVTALFGSAYRPAVGAFRILTAGTVVMTVSIVLIPYFLGQLARPGLLSLLAWVNVLVGLTLMRAFIPRWAVTGAAAAVALTYLCGTLVVFLLYLRLSASPTAGAAGTREEESRLLTQARPSHHQPSADV